MELLRGCVIGPSRLLFRAECSEVHSSSIDLYCRGPRLSAAVRAHTLKLGPFASGRLDALIAHVVPLRAEANIGAGVVEAIAVRVIHDLARDCPKD